MFGRPKAVGEYEKRWVTLHPSNTGRGKPADRFVIMNIIRVIRSTQPTKALQEVPSYECPQLYLFPHPDSKRLFAAS